MPCHLHTVHVVAMIAAGVFALLALVDLADQLRTSTLPVVTTIGSFALHVLALTVVTADGVLIALDRARVRGGAMAPEPARQLAEFLGAPVEMEVD